MTKQERQEAMAKAREAKKLKTTGQDTVQETGRDEAEVLDESDIAYDFAPYEVVKEQHDYGCRFILLLKGVHQAEFHGTEEECYQYAEAYIEKGDKSKVFDVSVKYAD